MTALGELAVAAVAVVAAIKHLAPSSKRKR